MRGDSLVEGYALSALLGAVFAGAGAWLTFGRNTLTKREHTDMCTANQAPIKVEIGHLKEGQDRVERKIDKVDEKVDATLAVLHKMNGDG